MSLKDFEREKIIESSSNGFYSDEAEKAILNVILENFEEHGHFALQLQEDDFVSYAHKIILKAIVFAKSSNLAVDLVSVGDCIDKIDHQNSSAILSELVGCISQWTHPFHAESYFRIVKELSTRRKAMDVVREIQQQLCDPGQEINGILDKMRTGSGDLMVGKHKWHTMQDVLMATYENLEKRVKGELTCISSGVSNVDAIIGGFFPGEMTVIGARPGVGKSVFGMNVALQAAKEGFRVGFCSREMTDIQFGQRIISHASRVNGMKLRRAELDEDDWLSIAAAIGPTTQLPVEFLFDVRTVEDLRAEIQRKVTREKLDMLVVDYMQIMQTQQKFKEDRLRVGHISTSLKQIALDFNIPVIVLAQVKRYAGGARAKMPTLEDLKDSGNIEQDADGVIFLHNPYDAEDEYVDPRDKQHFENFEKEGFTYLCLGVAKQRQGETGKACVLFNKRTMRYVGIDRTHSM